VPCGQLVSGQNSALGLRGMPVNCAVGEACQYFVQHFGCGMPVLDAVLCTPVAFAQLQFECAAAESWI
jgi:hypothetical protein